ncbi:DUF1573 domain-containing protein [Aquimarina hainanensis]|uniref:DUF1573 domain-containing protein n=1 Tax=Aquimarina hainanensis TaxID=1578017 RepID=A0ABW5N7T0_9FLAO
MMKKAIVFMSGLFVLSLFSCINNASATETPEAPALTAKEVTVSAPVMSFSETNYDFGTITEGEIVEHTFTFTNTGNAPLVITNAKGSCGCTVSKWSRDPIAPGATGSMLVAFNSNGKPNLQNKQVTITANTKKGKEILKIKAMVTPKTATSTGTPISK